MPDVAESHRSSPVGQVSPWEAVRRPSLVNGVLACALAVPIMLLGVVAVRSTDPIFESRATILLDHEDVRRVPDATPIHRLNALRLTYAALVPTEEIAGEIADDFGVPQGQIARRLSVGVNEDSLVMYPTATGPTAAAAMELAQALSNELEAYVRRSQVESGVAPDDRVVLQIVDSADRARKIEPTPGAATSAALLFGSLGLAGVYVVLQLLTASRRLGRPRGR